MSSVSNVSSENIVQQFIAQCYLHLSTYSYSPHLIHNKCFSQMNQESGALERGTSTSTTMNKYKKPTLWKNSFPPAFK